MNFSFFSITGWGIDLDNCDIEWFALEMNRDPSVVFEIAPKYCVSDAFVECEGYSLRRNAVAIMVIKVSKMQYLDAISKMTE